MFDDQAFRTWPAILAGAVVFGGLFAFVALLAEVVYGEPLRVTPAVLGIGGAAFVGYVAVVLYLRQARSSSE